MKHLLSTLTKTFARSAMNARKCHDTLECLESRIAPAVLLTVLDLDADGTADDIRIRGDGGKNIVTIEDNGANQLTISIDADGNGNTTGKKDLAPTNFIFNGDSVTLDVKLGGGNDTLNYSTTGNMSASTRMLNFDIGTGKNTASFSTGTFDVLNASQIDLNITRRIEDRHGHDELRRSAQERRRDTIRRRWASTGSTTAARWTSRSTSGPA